MSDLYVDWSGYHQKIEQLAGQIHNSGWEFDGILCLARGGLRVGDLLSRIFDRPLAILAVSSYGGAGGKTQGKIAFSEHLTATAANLGKRLLLVDDLVDSGVSLERTLQWLAGRYASQIQEVRTAVLWHKARSIVVPDYYVEFLPDNPWIHQPFEPYEQMNPARLWAKYEQLSIKV
ncbi:phosphoribosyltransferase [Oscillatoriales cyanobacterium LEGE 11467]|uniref:Phosphoribosyltransferase n=1 Tax=Zarconia navalis LEGE 11467 TaxID=1828826 RepID=A0A928Z929_9CYAN|nr:phosphoribosyltransferase family protein [Zarconia navalis]MBE9041259.1 phosphoribosyltransferase [Zarconia navalis LEGE 11467]